MDLWLNHFSSGLTNNSRGFAVSRLRNPANRCNYRSREKMIPEVSRLAANIVRLAGQNMEF